MTWLASADHLRGGAVVADQPDQRAALAAAAAPGEVDQVGRGGAGERVDRLARVADHGQVVAAAEPRLQQPLLDRVDVLVLVDDEVPVLRADLLGDVGVLLDRPHRGAQQVLEVDHAGRRA